MSRKKLSAQSFPVYTTADWEKRAEASLKGRKLGETQTFEGIKLKPLYTKADEQGMSQFPAEGDFRRGIGRLGYINNEWKVAQTLSIDRDLGESLALAFSRGQSSISFEVGEQIFSQIEVLEKFQQDFPYSMNGKEFHSRLIENIGELPSTNEATGFIAADPIALLVEQGTEIDEISDTYDRFFHTVHKANRVMPKVRTILVDTTPYHNGGANAVQELAIAINTAITHIEELHRRGLDIETIFSKFIFQFSIGANFFMELAKLRAARVLWSKIAEAYGIQEQDRGMVISAATSSLTKTLHDPYVNMLRAGNEAFVAVLGGVQYLHVSPYNEPEGKASQFADRIARNTQLIFKEETHITKTVDPAGGSWYVENLTTELAHRGWDLFLTIEEKGDILGALKQGWLQEEIAAVWAKREEAIAVRKETIVGTNQYADLHGEKLSTPNVKKEGQTGFIRPIPQRRLSESFELLREKASKLKEASIGLIPLGDLKSHKGRTDFINGFLTPGGIKVVLSGEVHSYEDAHHFMANTNFKHYCLCGSNEQYEEVGLQLMKELKEAFPNRKFFIAGLPEEQERWIEMGIDGFIHLKSNCYETIAAFLDEMEVGADE